MEGNRGLLYVRVMRTPSAGPVRRATTRSNSARAYVLRERGSDRAVIVSSGRGVHEALAAAAQCADAGARGRRHRHAVDRRGPADRALRVGQAAGPCRAEQRLHPAEPAQAPVPPPQGRVGSVDRIMAINTLDADGRPRFIHSGTYEELTAGVRAVAAAAGARRSRRAWSDAP